MRKLDKTKILSTEYKKWEESFTQNSENHPEYNSTKNDFYTDIFTNLLNIQDGLCAYTEIPLCDPEKVKDEFWEKGKFYKQNLKVKPFCKGGNLDHFDPELKKTKSWLWDNFFFIDTDVNNDKGIKKVDNFLKPDLPDYDEFKLLEYDINKHIFIANTSLDQKTQKRVNNMIEILGINLVKDIRQPYLDEKIEDITIGQTKIWKNTTVYQFPTAFEMIKKEYLKK